MSKYHFEYKETIGDKSIIISTDVIYPCITAKELSELVQTIHELIAEEATHANQ